MPEQPQDDNPHDILAAEEFGIGTRDERHPPDPTGIHEAHDVLAAEEFAMPSPADHAEHYSGGSGPERWIPWVALALLAAVLLRRRRR
jgi:MYXO-CTERM domain-containing protein